MPARVAANMAGVDPRHRNLLILLATAALITVLLLRVRPVTRRPDPSQDLIRALSSRDEASALRALAAGADANTREATPARFDPQGRGHTALYLATRIHSRRLIAELLARGADPNERYEAGGTPLMQAVALDNPEAAGALLEHGAQVGAKAADGNTALHYACLLPSDRLARLLVAHGAQVNARNHANETPVRLAKLRHNATVARYLESVGGRE
jgi:ankyrin repeat protein